MGGTWPKWFVLKGTMASCVRFSYRSVVAPSGIDLFSVATCKVTDMAVDVKGMSGRYPMLLSED